MKKKLKRLAPPAGAKILRDERAFGEETLDFTIPELENPVSPRSNQDKELRNEMANINVHLPEYIKETHIESTEIRSPVIAGNQ